MPADAVESNNGIKADPSRSVPLVVQGRFCENLFIFMENLNLHTQMNKWKKHGIRNVPKKKLNHLDFLEEAPIGCIFFCQESVFEFRCYVISAEFTRAILFLWTFYIAGQHLSHNREPSTKLAFVEHILKRFLVKLISKLSFFFKQYFC